MSKQLRYMGEFLSRAGVRWRVEILQEADAAFGSVGQLTFEADEALVIDWKHTDKEEVICGSEATLKIESPGDRTYEDLYTIEVGRIRMDVYRENALYWSGALDPEFYEEPYEAYSHYVVTLTFSDFGILDRLKYNLAGMQTLQAILTDAITRSTINHTGIDADTYCTTYFATGGKANPAALAVRSENFYDEDAEPSTLKEVIEGILQPLALKMIQRNGKIYVFDLNGLRTLAASRAITWDGDSQTMGVDKVANNVKVNFSPYSTKTLISGEEIEFMENTDVSWAGLAGQLYYSNRLGWSNPRFVLYTGNTGKGLSYLGSAATYFRIAPIVGGPSEYVGVAARATNERYNDIIFNGWEFGKVTQGSGIEMLRTQRVFLPKLSEDDAGRYLVKISLEMLLDARYNPFSNDMGKDAASKHNFEDDYEDIKENTTYAFIPFSATIYDGPGVAASAILHADNRGAAEYFADSYPEEYTNNTSRVISWLPGKGSFGSAWLEYWEEGYKDDETRQCAVLGWKTNKPCFGRSRMGTPLDSIQVGSITLRMDNVPNGEYLPYPAQGGYLEISVYDGVRCFSYDDRVSFNNPKTWNEKGLYSKVRWLLYKAPKVELVKNNLVFNAAELDDVEYSGYINKHAKEEISIDTVCGTANTTCPTAKGIYCRATDSLQIQTLKRAGVTDHPEKLLIGTLYSQFAARKTTLSGEAKIDTGGLCKYTEQNQSGKVFMMLAETQDVITDTTDAQYTEFNADEYEAIEEVN